jgi:catechol 2,3-dioxygenase-like lactoylglutathione lyase family enzyme
LARRLAAIAFLVPDYAAGLSWFCGALGFALIEDVDMGAGKRWVVVSADRFSGARIVLAKAEGAAQRAAIGAAAGGRVGYFLETDDFDADHAAFKARGVRFLEPPRREPYGTVAVFADPWGNKWDLIQPARAPA